MRAPPITGIKETCIYVKDLQRCRNFYEGLLHLPCFSFVSGSHAFFNAGRSVLLCFDPKSGLVQERLPRHYGMGELHFAFEVERTEYDPWLKWLELQDIPVEHHHEWPGGFRSAYFRDPDRNCVEIIETGMWEFGQKR